MTSLAPGLARSLPRARTREATAWWWVPAAVVLAAVTWPVGSLSPSSLNAYFPVALHLVFTQGLEPGRDVVFTYGPLGFLAFPLVVSSGTALLAFAYAALVHTALVAAVLRVSLRRLPWPAALATAVVAGAAPVPLVDVPVLLVLAACLAALTEPAAMRFPWLAVGGGAAVALELLVKVNDGVVCLVLLALAVWRRPGGLRSELVLVASCASMFAVLWRAANGRFGDLETWARLSVHLVASYAQGMGLGGPARDLEVAAALLAGTAGVAFAHAGSLGRPRGSAVWLALACFCFAFFKEGFVRADASHESIFFAALAVALLLVDWSTPWLRVCALLLAAVSLAELGGSRLPAEAVLAAVATWLAVRTASSRTVLAAGAAVAAGLVLTISHGADALPDRPAVAPLRAELRELATVSHRAEAIDVSRAAVRRSEALPPALVAQLRGHTVDVEPYGATFAWAYGLDWQPEPLLESYADYDPALDRIAADELTAQRILQLPWTAIDHQNPLWQAPALVLAEICNYRRVAADASGFTVLSRTQDVCGTPRPLGNAVARDDAWVDVPRAAPGEIVYASIRVASGGFTELLRSLALRPREIRLQTRGLGGGTYKLVPATAAESLVLRLPRAGVLPQPRGGTAISRFRLERGRTARVSFYALPVHL